ncbi:MAG: hypothetical protein ACKVQC_00010, partial [Elusimicrobiota bacterium]
MKSPQFSRSLSFFLAIIYFFVQCAFAHKPETTIWEERKKNSSSNQNQYSMLDRSFVSSFPNVSIGNLPLSGGGQVKNFGDNNSNNMNSAPAVFSSLTPFGTIRKVLSPTTSKSKGTILHIQDIHQNFEAQKNISNAIQTLTKENKIAMIGLEGAFDKIDLSPFHNFPEPEAVKKTADYLLKKNEISGPIHAVLSLTPTPYIPRPEGERLGEGITTHHSQKIQTVGIDDQSHYNANVEAYQQSASLVPKIKLELAKEEEFLRIEKSKNFSPELQAFDEKITKYREGTLRLGEYLKTLSSSSHIPHPEGERLGEGNHLKSFLQAYHLEESLNFKQVDRERSLILEKLLTRLSKNETDALMSNSAAYKSGHIHHADFYAYLKELCDQKGIALHQYAAMNNYLKYILLSDQIDAEKLFFEIKETENKIYVSLTKKEIEKELIEKSKKLYLEQKLINFSLTKEEWGEYKSPLPQSGRGLGRGINFSSFENFYNQAEIRDEKMAGNFLKIIESSNDKNQLTNKCPKSKSSIGTCNLDFENYQNAVLVTGGFHSAGINERLLNAGYNVVQFTPKLTKVDTENGSAYLSVFAQEKTPLEKLFEGDKLFLAKNPISVSARVSAGLLTWSVQLWLSFAKKLPIGNVEESLSELTGKKVSKAAYLVKKEDNKVELKVTFNEGFIETNATYDIKGNILSAQINVPEKSIWAELKHTIPIALGLKKSTEFLKGHLNSFDPAISYIRILSLRILTFSFWFGIISTIGIQVVFYLRGNALPVLLMILAPIILGIAMQLLAHVAQRKIFPGAKLSLPNQYDIESGIAKGRETGDFGMPFLTVIKDKFLEDDHIGHDALAFLLENIGWMLSRFSSYHNTFQEIRGTYIPDLLKLMNTKKPFQETTPKKFKGLELLAISPSGRWAAILLRGKSAGIKIIDLHHKQYKTIISYEGPLQPTNPLILFTPDDKRVIISPNQTHPVPRLVFYSLPDGTQEKWLMPSTLNNPIMRFDGERIFLGFSTLYNMNTKETLKFSEFNSAIEGYAFIEYSEFRPNHTDIATFDINGVIRIFDSETGKQRLDLSALGQGFNRLRYSVDGTKLYCYQKGEIGAQHNNHYVLNAENGEVLIREVTGLIYDQVLFSDPKSKYLMFIRGPDIRIYFVDLTRLTPVHTYPGLLDSNTLKFNSTGEIFGFITDQNELSLLQMTPKLKQIDDIPALLENILVQNYAFSIDGRYLAVIGREQDAPGAIFIELLQRTVFFIDLKTRKIVHQIKVINENPSLIFNPDSLSVWIGNKMYALPTEIKEPKKSKKKGPTASHSGQWRRDSVVEQIIPLMATLTTLLGTLILSAWGILGPPSAGTVFVNGLISLILIGIPTAYLTFKFLFDPWHNERYEDIKEKLGTLYNTEPTRKLYTQHLFKLYSLFTGTTLISFVIANALLVDNNYGILIALAISQVLGILEHLKINWILKDSVPAS